MNKSGFELRTEVLEMAKDYMDQSWNMNVEFTKKMVETGEKNMKDLEKAMQPYSMDALMEKANEFYSFVTKKD